MSEKDELHNKKSKGSKTKQPKKSKPAQRKIEESHERLPSGASQMSVKEENSLVKSKNKTKLLPQPKQKIKKENDDFDELQTKTAGMSLQDTDEDEIHDYAAASPTEKKGFDTSNPQQKRKTYKKEDSGKSSTASNAERNESPVKSKGFSKIKQPKNFEPLHVHVPAQQQDKHDDVDESLSNCVSRMSLQDQESPHVKSKITKKQSKLQQVDPQVHVDKSLSNDDCTGDSKLNIKVVTWNVFHGSGKNEGSSGFSKARDLFTKEFIEKNSSMFYCIQEPKRELLPGFEKLNFACVNIHDGAIGSPSTLQVIDNEMKLESSNPKERLLLTYAEQDIDSSATLPKISENSSEISDTSSSSIKLEQEDTKMDADETIAGPYKIKDGGKTLNVTYEDPPKGQPVDHEHDTRSKDGANAQVETWPGYYDEKRFYCRKITIEDEKGNPIYKFMLVSHHAKYKGRKKNASAEKPKLKLDKSNKVKKLEIFFENMRKMANAHQVPIIIGGDFNIDIEEWREKVENDKVKMPKKYKLGPRREGKDTIDFIAIVDPDQLNPKTPTNCEIKNIKAVEFTKTQPDDDEAEHELEIKEEDLEKIYQKEKEKYQTPKQQTKKKSKRKSKPPPTASELFDMMDHDPVVAEIELSKPSKKEN